MVGVGERYQRHGNRPGMPLSHYGQRPGTLVPRLPRVGVRRGRRPGRGHPGPAWRALAASAPAGCPVAPLTALNISCAKPPPPDAVLPWLPNAAAATEAKL